MSNQIQSEIRRGPKRKFLTPEAYVQHRDKYIKDYYKRDDVKARVKIYQARNKANRRKKKILEYFNESPELYRETLLEVLKNEANLRVANELIQARTS